MSIRDGAPRLIFQGRGGQCEARYASPLNIVEQAPMHPVGLAAILGKKSKTAREFMRLCGGNRSARVAFSVHVDGYRGFERVIGRRPERHSGAVGWERSTSWSSVYTTQQNSRNQVGYVNATANVDVNPTWSLQGLAHVRSFYQTTADGNSTNVQPCADPTVLCFNDPVTPANGLNGQQFANTLSRGRDA